MRKPFKREFIFAVPVVQFNLFSRVFANPAISLFDKTKNLFVLSRIYAYVLLMERKAVKLIYYGRDGTSWLRAFMVAVFVKALSEGQSSLLILRGKHWGGSLAFLLMSMRSNGKRALFNGIIINTAPYTFLLMPSFSQCEFFI